MSTGVATYYDRLLRWNRAARWFGYGGGARTLTVHRALADPAHGGRPTYTRLHDLLAERLQDYRAPRVLDAGCGLGGTMIALAQALGAACVGLTLSSDQAGVANAQARRCGLAARVRAVVGTYDLPPPGPFDAVVAIESLAHSVNPAVSFGALARVLAPGGRLVVVDDMPEPQASPSELDAFKRGWGCPVLWSWDAYAAACIDAGLELVDAVDLTGDCRPRPAWQVALLEVCNRAARPLVPRPVGQVLDAHRGGLALERLLRSRQVRYRMLVAKRPELRVS